jgi:arylsulfatase A-like enzyme
LDFGGPPTSDLSATADYCVGLLRAAVADAGLADRTTFVIAADHGFVTVRDEMNVAPLLREPQLDGHVRWQADRWYLWAELLPSFNGSRHQPILDRVLDRLLRTPGIARVVRPGAFEALGYPDYTDNVYVPGHYLVVSEIDTAMVVDVEDDRTERRRAARANHGHGYLPDHPAMYPALIFSGAGIARGTIGHVRNVDVAPAIAALLGLELPTATGRVLKEALVR